MRHDSDGETEVLGGALDRVNLVFAARTLSDNVIYYYNQDTLTVSERVVHLHLGFKVEIYLMRGHLGVLGNALAKFQAVKELALWTTPEASG
ncbi:hypothetical protein NpNSSI1_00002033 [Neofusicoccum parvum]|nr:hypothetical protein NpNSSI1_00002033 [Neofusicoccum parvum]